MKTSIHLKWAILLLNILTGISVLYAQSPDILSRHLALNQCQTDSCRLVETYNIGRRFIGVNNDSLFYYGQKVEKLANRVGKVDSEFMGLLLTGIHFSSERMYEKADSVYASMHRYKSRVKSSLVLPLFAGMAGQHLRRSRYDSAKIIYETSLNYLDSNDVEYHQYYAGVLYNLATVFRKTGDMKSALIAIYKGETILKDSKSQPDINRERQAGFLSQRATIYEILGLENRVLEIREKLLEYAVPNSTTYYRTISDIALLKKQLGDSIGFSRYTDTLIRNRNKLSKSRNCRLYVTEARLLAIRKDFEGSRQAMQNFDVCSNELGYDALSRLEMRALVGYDSKNYLEAMQYLIRYQDSLSNSATYSLSAELGKLDYIIDCALKTGTLNDIPQYIKRYQDVSDSLRLQHVNGEIVLREVEYETDRIKEEKFKLENRSETQSKLIDTQKGNITILICSLFVFALLSYLLWASRHNLKEKSEAVKTLNRELNHRAANQLSLAYELILDQRRQIGDEQAKASLQKSESQLMALREVNRALANKSDDLVQADQVLQKVAENLQAASPHPFKLDLQLEAITIHGNAASRSALILSELMSNSIKYAFPNQADAKASLSLKQSDRGISMSYVDNGPGKDGRTRGTGVGSELIEAMLEDMDAEFEEIAGDDGTGYGLRWWWGS